MARIELQRIFLVNRFLVNRNANENSYQYSFIFFILQMAVKAKVDLRLL